MLGEANVNKHGKKRNAMLWEIASFSYFLRSFALFSLPYLSQVGGSLISEEFFKAANHGIPKAEWQVIRVKKEFIPGFIYSLCCLIVSPNVQRVNTILPDVSLTEQKRPNFLDNIRT